jgi:hypothetical protein
MGNARYQTPKNGYEITPSDTANESIPFAAIYVGVAGDVAVVTGDGTVLLHKGVPTGGTIRLGGIRVNSTNTTATDMIGYI